MKKTKKPTAIPVLPNARVGSIVGLLETLNEQGVKIDIYKLSESLGFKLNDLMPITEAAELLGFVKIESGDIELSDLGRQVVDGDENDKKSIFRQQMLDDYKDLAVRMGRPGASERTAALILKKLRNK